MSIPVSAEPLALLYKAAVNSINAALQPSVGKDPIQSAAGGDNSPEATASRIVSLSTAMYDAYREHNQLKDTAASREQFADVIRGGVEKGFKEAQQVPQGLGADVAAEIDRTFELVMLGLRDFATVEHAQPGGPTPLPDPV